jgi:hypothetical protein
MVGKATPAVRDACLTNARRLTPSMLPLPSLSFDRGIFVSSIPVVYGFGAPALLSCASTTAMAAMFTISLTSEPR